MPILGWYTKKKTFIFNLNFTSISNKTYQIRTIREMVNGKKRGSWFRGLSFPSMEETIYLPQHIRCSPVYTSSESNIVIMTTMEASTWDQLSQFFIFLTYFRVKKHFSASAEKRECICSCWQAINYVQKITFFFVAFCSRQFTSQKTMVNKHLESLEVM